jgi:hypothetical protein
MQIRKLVYSVIKLGMKITAALCVAALLMAPVVNFHPAAATEKPNTNGLHIYIPLMSSNYRQIGSILLGVYTPGYLGDKQVIQNELKALDNWSGVHLSIAGTFVGIQDPNPAYNVPVPLQNLWDAGYTAFINLMTQGTATQIANGGEDQHIRNVASAYSGWVKQGRDLGQTRMAFIAPLPEGNITTGNSYGGDPNSFKSAYWRIRDIFNQELGKSGLPASSVKWVFAPNGQDEPGRPSFENFYPGDQTVDIVAFSSYNWGYCYGWQYDSWDMGDKLFKPYVQRMQVMAPSKPVFISQTATSSSYPNHYSYSSAQKDSWLLDSYTYLAGLAGVRAVIYFNIDKECDWAFYKSGSVQYQGYVNAVQHPDFVYISPASIAKEFTGH